MDNTYRWVLSMDDPIGMHAGNVARTWAQQELSMDSIHRYHCTLAGQRARGQQVLSMDNIHR